MNCCCCSRDEVQGEPRLLEISELLSIEPQVPYEVLQTHLSSLPATLERHHVAKAPADLLAALKAGKLGEVRPTRANLGKLSP